MLTLGYHLGCLPQESARTVYCEDYTSMQISHYSQPDSRDPSKLAAGPDDPQVRNLHRWVACGWVALQAVSALVTAVQGSLLRFLDKFPPTSHQPTPPQRASRKLEHGSFQKQRGRKIVALVRGLQNNNMYVILNVWKPACPETPKACH